MDPTYQGRVPQVPYSNRSRSRFRLTTRMLLISGAILVSVIVGFVMLANSGDKTGPLQQRLNARLGTLEKMAAEGKKNISSTELKEFNGRLSIQLTSDITSINKVASEKRVDKAITAAEADTASFEILEDARLNSRFDDTYRRIVSQKLDSTTALMKELYDKTRSQSLKAALGASYRSLKQLETQLTPTATP